MRWWPVLLLGLAGCGSGTPEPAKPLGPPMSVDQAEVISTYPEFARKFAQESLGGKVENGLVSPLSAYETLSLLLYGAGGDSYDEYAEVMGLQEPPPELVIDSIGGFKRSVSRDVMSSASAIWMIWPIDVRPSYQADVADSMGAVVERIGSAGIGAENRINEWIGDATDGRLKEMPGDLTPQTALIAMSANAFSGRWTIPFEKGATKEQDFAAPEGSVQVPMMMREGAMLYAGEGWEAAALMFEDGFRFVAVLPTDGSPADLLEHDLSVFTAKESHASDGTLRLPRFKVRQTKDLSTVLSDLGAPVFAGRSEVDLSGISHELKGEYWIQGALQANVLELDEEGVKASSVTEAGIAASAPDGSLVLDRPFLYFIEHVETGFPIYVGICADPSKQS